MPTPQGPTAASPSPPKEQRSPRPPLRKRGKTAAASVKLLQQGIGSHARDQQAGEPVLPAGAGHTQQQQQRMAVRDISPTPAAAVGALGQQNPACSKQAGSLPSVATGILPPTSPAAVGGRCSDQASCSGRVPANDLGAGGDAHGADLWQQHHQQQPVQLRHQRPPSHQEQPEHGSVSAAHAPPSCAPGPRHVMAAPQPAQRAADLMAQDAEAAATLMALRGACALGRRFHAQPQPQPQGPAQGQAQPQGQGQAQARQQRLPAIVSCPPAGWRERQPACGVLAPSGPPAGCRGKRPPARGELEPSAPAAGCSSARQPTRDEVAPSAPLAGCTSQCQPCGRDCCCGSKQEHLQAAGMQAPGPPQALPPMPAAPTEAAGCGGASSLQPQARDGSSCDMHAAADAASRAHLPLGACLAAFVAGSGAPAPAEQVLDSDPSLSSASGSVEALAARTAAAPLTAEGDPADCNWSLPGGHGAYCKAVSCEVSGTQV